MSFETIARDYLHRLKSDLEEAKITGQYTAELSFRPSLDAFIRRVYEALNPDIKGVFEPKSQLGVGRPDWRFYNSSTYGVYGYMDSKGLVLTENIVISDYLEQINKYLSLGHQVILTDGIDFVFFSPNTKSPELISLIQKPIKSNDLTTAEINPALENRFKQFFDIEDARSITEEKLVKEAALRAKLLASSVLELSDLPTNAAVDDIEKQSISVLNKIKTIVQNHHDPTLRDPTFFADFVAQVLIFGLLYSHRRIAPIDAKPSERYDQIIGFWKRDIEDGFTDALRPFRAIFELLSDELASLSALGTWFQDCALLLAYITLDESQRVQPDYHKLFEAFLEAYDPGIRFDFGAFYTPKSLAVYMVRLTKEIVRSEYGKVDLYARDNKLIDPASGTGTFLEQLFLQKPDQQDIPTLIGFEILPAPYALSHYRMAMVSADHAHRDKINIILTNTLSDELEKTTASTETTNVIQTELEKARKLAAPPLTLIIGNPPSSDSSPRSEGKNFSYIEEMLEDFRPPAGSRTSRQNIQKQVKNEFMKFLRWATNKLLLSKPGFLVFVVPASFNEHQSYKYARKWFSENFKKIWIMDLDKDGRTGVRASSMFNTLQGRTLLIAYTGMPDDEVGISSFQYSSIADFSLSEKHKWLEDETNAQKHQEIFSEIDLPKDNYVFRPVKKYDSNQYSLFWPLYPEKKKPHEDEAFVFERHCSGIKFAPSSFFTHIRKGVLFRKLRDIGNEDIPAETVKSRWFAGQSRPPSNSKFSSAVRKEINSKVIDDEQKEFIGYSYRPMLNLYAFVSESVLQTLSRAGGGGTRYRPELISAFSRDSTKGIALSPAPKDIGESLHRFVSFCWHLPDNDLTARGNAHIFCDYYPVYKGRGSWDPTPKLNINSSLIGRLSSEFGEEISTDQIVYYCYAVLCSDAYLDAFEGALFSVADASKRPRIPFANNKAVFLNIAALGEHLANLEKDTEDLPENVLGEEFTNFANLIPGPFRLVDGKIDPKNNELLLLAEGGAKISISPIPAEVLEFQVSGYQVIQQWLKVHTYKYSRVDFDDSQYKELINLLERIIAQIKIVSKLDESIRSLLTDPAQLIRA